jgi:phospholipase/carboxylesterase
MQRSPVTFTLREAASTPVGALVLMHGRGADADDLAPLLDILDPGQRLLGALPRGPFRLPPGGRHWYIVRQVGFPDPGTFLASFQELSQHVDALLADRDIPSERTVVGGFSQGAVMAYSLALGAGHPRPAAIIAFSGFIPSVEGFELALADRAGLPVSISHGSLDPVISVNFGRDARDRLSAAGLAVIYREDPVGHTITPAALAQARAVLEAALPA